MAAIHATSNHKPRTTRSPFRCRASSIWPGVERRRRVSFGFERVCRHPRLLLDPSPPIRLPSDAAAAAAACCVLARPPLHPPFNGGSTCRPALVLPLAWLG